MSRAQNTRKLQIFCGGFRFIHVNAFSLISFSALRSFTFLCVCSNHISVCRLKSTSSNGFSTYAYTTNRFNYLLAFVCTSTHFNFESNFPRTTQPPRQKRATIPYNRTPPCVCALCVYPRSIRNYSQWQSKEWHIKEPLQRKRNHLIISITHSATQ